MKGNNVRGGCKEQKKKGEGRKVFEYDSGESYSAYQGGNNEEIFWMGTTSPVPHGQRKELYSRKKVAA